MCIIEGNIIVGGQISPEEIERVFCHLEQACALAELVKSDEIPHLLVHGPSRAGKRTCIKYVSFLGNSTKRLHLDTPPPSSLLLIEKLKSLPSVVTTT
ncbi:hypothetical protein COOONC_21259 [Cooperia oncophora]